MVLVLVGNDLALLLLVGVVVELAEGDTVLVDVVESPGKRQTVAHLSGDSVLLTDAVNQLLSGESDIDDRFVRREVESIVEAIDCTGHDESPRHSAVLRLADVLTERVLLQTTLTEHIVARVHGSVIHTHLIADSIERVEDGVDEALLTQSLVPFHVPIVRFAIISFVVSIKKRV